MPPDTAGGATGAVPTTAAAGSTASVAAGKMARVDAKLETVPVNEGEEMDVAREDNSEVEAGAAEAAAEAIFLTDGMADGADKGEDFDESELNAAEAPFPRLVGATDGVASASGDADRL